jgi:DNA-binding Xre family transcriptional regulator
MKLQIKEICAAQGIKSAYELAKRTKLNMPTAYRAFANDIKQFTPQTLKALCDALKCSPDDIFGYNEPQTVKPQLLEPDAGKPAKPPQTLETTASAKRMTTEQVAQPTTISPVASSVCRCSFLHVRRLLTPWVRTFHSPSP